MATRRERKDRTAAAFALARVAATRRTSPRRMWMRVSDPSWTMGGEPPAAPVPAGRASPRTCARNAAGMAGLKRDGVGRLRRRIAPRPTPHTPTLLLSHSASSR
jgi:hypothetical protein